MAGRGPAGSGQRSRKRDDDALKEQFTDIEPDEELRGPELPDDVFGDDEDWHPRTRAWWKTWRRSAQAKTFTETDWDFLVDTALMHHVMWTKGRWEFAGELRLRAAKFGATPEDRMRLKLNIRTPGDADPEANARSAQVVTDISSRRARLSG
jgi:hypothetical protein